MNLPIPFAAAAFAALTTAAVLPSQNLRRGITGADAVVVARQVGSHPHGEALVLHTLRVARDLTGGGLGKAIVLDWPKLGLHLRPVPRQTRLYCLQDASAEARRLDLPAEKGPYFKMSGWPGSNPPVSADPSRDPIVDFASVLIRAADGASADATAAELAELAVTGTKVVRLEAAKMLTERGYLRAHVGAAQWSRIVARATGETEDISYKIALSQLCAEQRLAGLVEQLAVSLGPVSDPEYARAVGRIARVLHGEEATSILARRLRHLRRPEDRTATLLAIGATRTDAALALLLQMSKADRDPKAVEAALREHHSPRALEAVLRSGGK